MRMYKLRNSNEGLFSLTVIIPNYNNANYLRQCIQSILNQTYLPDEILIVDDCSADSSRSIIAELEKENSIVRGIYLGENKGVSNARNVGLIYAKTEYVTFTDSDDYYYSKDKLRNEMELIMFYLEKGKDIVAYSGIVIVENDGKKIYKYPGCRLFEYMQGNISFYLASGYKNVNIPRDYCVKKKILLDVGAYSFYKNFYEDFDLLFRLTQKVEFYSTLKPGIAYRRTPTGLSKRSQEEHKCTVEEIVKKYTSDYSNFKKIKGKVFATLWKCGNKLLVCFRRFRFDM